MHSLLVLCSWTLLSNLRHVSGGLIFNDSSIPSVMTVVKIFGATNVTSPWCATPDPYDAAWDSVFSKTTTTTLTPPDAAPARALSAASDSTSGPEVKTIPYQSWSDRRPKHQPFGHPYRTFPDEIEYLLLKAVLSAVFKGLTKASMGDGFEISDTEIAGNLTSVLGTGAGQEKLYKLLSDGLIPKRFHKFEDPRIGPQRASRTARAHSAMISKKKRNLSTMSTVNASNPDPAFDDITGLNAPYLEPEDSLEELITSDTLVAIVECLVADTTFSGSELKLEAVLNNLGTCVCTSAAVGYSRNDNYNDICGILNLIETALICAKVPENFCDGTMPHPIPDGLASCNTTHLNPNSESTDPNVDYDMWLHPLESVVPAPGEPIPTDLTDQIVQDEGLTYYYGMRASSQAQSMAATSLCGNETLVELVPGWKTEYVVNSIHEGDLDISNSGRGSIMLAQIARRKCDVMVVVRGTATGWEWNLNFQYRQVFGNLTSSSIQNFPAGKYHVGFAAFVASIMPSFQVWYDTTVLPQCGPSTKPRIIVLGHSLGAAVATTLSHFIALKYQGLAATSALLFAPPNAGDAVAMDEYNRIVNVRAIVASLDAVPALPCVEDQTPTGLPMCPLGNVPNDPYWETAKYVTTGGRKLFDTTSLAELSGNSNWKNTYIADLSLQVFPKLALVGSLLNDTSLQFGPNHICAYHCFTGQFCQDPAVSQWGCSSTAISTQPCGFYGQQVSIDLSSLLG